MSEVALANVLIEAAVGLLTTDGGPALTRNLLKDLMRTHLDTESHGAQRLS